MPRRFSKSRVGRAPRRAGLGQSAALLAGLALLGGPALGQSSEDVRPGAPSVVRPAPLPPTGGGIARQATQATQATQAQGYVSPFSPAGASATPLGPVQLSVPVTTYEGQLFPSAPPVTITTTVPQFSVSTPVIVNPPARFPGPVSEDVTNVSVGAQTGFTGQPSTGAIGGSSPQVFFSQPGFLNLEDRVNANTPTTGEDVPQEETPTEEPATVTGADPAAVQRDLTAERLREERDLQQRIQLQQLAVTLQEGSLLATQNLLAPTYTAPVYDPVADIPGQNSANQSAIQEQARQLGARQRELLAEDAGAQVAIATGADDVLLLVANRVQEETENEVDEEARRNHNAARDQLDDPDLQERERRARAEQEALDRERELRERHPERDRNAQESDELDAERDRLDEEGDDLEEEQDNQERWEDELEERLRGARQRERDARRGNPPPADPNCRGAACQRARGDQTSARQEQVQASRSRDSLNRRQEVHDRGERNWDRDNTDLQERLDRGEGLSREEHRARLATRQAERARADYEASAARRSDLRDQAKERKLTGAEQRELAQLERDADAQAERVRAEYARDLARRRELGDRAEEGRLSPAEQEELSYLAKFADEKDYVKRLEQQAGDLNEDLRDRVSLDDLQQDGDPLTPDQQADLDWRLARRKTLREGIGEAEARENELDEEFDEWQERIEEEYGEDVYDSQGPNDALPEDVLRQAQEWENRLGDARARQGALEAEIKQVERGQPTRGTFNDFATQSNQELTDQSNQLGGALDQIAQARAGIGRGGEQAPEATAGTARYDAAREAYERQVAAAQAQAELLGEQLVRDQQDRIHLSGELDDLELIRDLERQRNRSPEDERSLQQARKRLDKQYAGRSIESLQRELGRASRGYERAEKELAELQGDINSSFNDLRDLDLGRVADAATNFTRGYNARYGNTLRPDGSVDQQAVRNEVERLTNGLADVQARDAQLGNLAGTRNDFESGERGPNLTPEQRDRAIAQTDRNIARVKITQQDAVRELSEDGYHVSRGDFGTLQVAADNPLIAKYNGATQRAQETVRNNPLLPARAPERILLAQGPRPSSEDRLRATEQREADRLVLSDAYERGGFEGYQAERDRQRQRDIARLQAEADRSAAETMRLARLQTQQTKSEDARAAETQQRDRVGDLAIASLDPHLVDQRDRAAQDASIAAFHAASDAAERRLEQAEMRDQLLEFTEDRLQTLQGRVDAGTSREADIGEFRSLLRQVEQSNTQLASARGIISRQSEVLPPDEDTAATFDAQSETLRRQLTQVEAGLQSAHQIVRDRREQREAEDRLLRFGTVPLDTSADATGISFDPIADEATEDGVRLPEEEDDGRGLNAAVADASDDASDEPEPATGIGDTEGPAQLLVPERPENEDRIGGDAASGGTSADPAPLSTPNTTVASPAPESNTPDDERDAPAPATGGGKTEGPAQVPVPAQPADEDRITRDAPGNGALGERAPPATDNNPTQPPVAQDGDAPPPPRVRIARMPRRKGTLAEDAADIRAADARERDAREDFVAWAAQAVNGFVEPSNATRNALPRILAALADQVGPAQVAQLTYRAISRFEDGPAPDAAAFVQALFAEAAADAAANGRPNAAVATQLAQARFLEAILLPANATAWQLSPERTATLTEDLKQLVGDLSAAFGAVARDARDAPGVDPVAELGALASQLTLSRIDTPSAPEAAGVLRRIAAVQQRLEKVEDFPDADAAASAALAASEALRGYLIGARAGADQETLQTLLTQLAGTEQLLRRSLSAARRAGSAEDFDALETPIVQSGRREAGFLLAQGNYAGALNVLYSLPDNAGSLAALVATLNRTEANFAFLTAAQRAQLAGVEHNRLSSVEGIRGERIRLLRQWVTFENGGPIVLQRLAYELEDAGDIAGALAALADGLIRTPDNLSLLGEQLRLQITQAGGPRRSALVARLVNALSEDVLPAVAVAAGGLGARGDLDGLAALTDAVRQREVDSALRVRLEILLAQARLTALQAQPPSEDIDNQIARELDAAERALAEADGLDPAVRAAFQATLDRANQTFRNVLAWQGAIATGLTPAEGFLNVTRQAVAVGRLDIARDAFAGHIRDVRRGAEEDGLDREQLLSALHESAAVLQLVRARLQDPNLTPEQRGLAEDFLRSSVSEFQALVHNEVIHLEAKIVQRRLLLHEETLRAEDVDISDVEVRPGGVARTTQLRVRSRQPGVDRLRRAIAGQLAYLRALRQVELRGRLAGFSAGEEQDLFLAREGADARRALGVAEAAIQANNAGLADALEDGDLRHIFERQLAELSVLRARRDATEDFRADRNGGARGGLRAKVERALNGFVTGVPLGRQYADRVEKNAADTKARKTGVRPRVRYLESQSLPASVNQEDFEDNYTRDLLFLRDREAYLQSRLLDLTYEDTTLSREDQHAVLDAHDEWFARVLRRWGTYNAATWPGLSGIGARERAEAQFRLDVVAQNRLQRLEDTFNRAVAGGDPQAAFLAAVQLREAALAGEIDQFRRYVNFTWGRLGPVKATELLTGQDEDASELLVRATADAQLLQPALIRAAYRLPNELSVEDRTLLEDRGFIVDGQYAIPKSFRLRPTAGTTEFSTESIVDEFINAEKALELAATVVIPGGVSGRLATEAFGQLTLRYIARRVLQEGGVRAIARVAIPKLAYEAALFTGLSRAASAGLDPELLQSENFWSLSALGKEYLHNIVVLGALKVTGAVAGAGEQALARKFADALASRPVELAFRATTGAGKIALEAEVLTQLHGVFTGNTITAEDRIGNLLTVVLLRAFHAGQGESPVAEIAAEARARRQAYELWARVNARERELLLQRVEESTLLDRKAATPRSEDSTLLDRDLSPPRSEDSTLLERDVSTLRQEDSTLLDRNVANPRSEDSTLRDGTPPPTGRLTITQRDLEIASEDRISGSDGKSDVSTPRAGSESGSGGARANGGPANAPVAAAAAIPIYPVESSSSREGSGPRAEADIARPGKPAESSSLFGNSDPLSSGGAAPAPPAPAVAGAHLRLRDRLRLLPEDVTVEINGGEPIRLGAWLGQGRTTTAFRDADPAHPNQAYRLLRRGYDWEDFRLDEYGYEITTELEAGSKGLYRVARQRGEWEITSVSDPRFADLVGGVLTRVDLAEGRASERIAAQKGGITRGQLHALDNATRYFNRNGIIWTDNHFGNFDFERVPGTADTWRLVIFDTGGFFPAVGEPGPAQYANARTAQEAFNLRGSDWFRDYNAAQWMDPVRRRLLLIGLKEQAWATARDIASPRIDWKTVFGNSPGALIGTPMAMVDRPGYRRLASQDPALADALSLRHTGRSAPTPVPFEPSAGLDGLRRPRSLTEIEAIEDLFYGTGQATPEDIFRVRETESITLGVGP